MMILEENIFQSIVFNRQNFIALVDRNKQFSYYNTSDQDSTETQKHGTGTIVIV
jgi:hypothetical protein